MKHTPTGDPSPREAPAPPPDALSAAELLSAALRRCAEGGAAPHRALRWLLPLSRQLGLGDDEALALAAPHPPLADLLRRQLAHGDARAAAAVADERDEVPAAIAASLQHIAACPEDDEARLALGRLLLDRGEVDAAEALYARGCAEAEGPLLMALKAELLMARGRFTLAHAAAHAALERAPLDPEVLVTFAETCRWVAREAARREALERALELHAHHPLARSRLLEAPRPAQSPEERLAEARRAFDERPARHRHHALVLALLDAGRAPLAAEEAARLLARHPQSLSARLALSRALLASGARREAAARLEEVMAADAARPEALALWARLCVAAADAEGLDAALERLAALDDAPGVELLRLELLVALGAEEEAHEGYARLVARHPLAHDALRAYAQHLLAADLPERALELCARLLAHDPRDAHARCLAAEACAAAGDAAQARRHLRGCAEHPRARLVQARLDLAAGRLPAARRAAAALLALNPADPDAVALSVQCAARAEHNADALLSLYQTLDLERLAASTLALLAFLLGQIERPEEADEALDYLLARPAPLPFEAVYYACEAARGARRADVLLALTETPRRDPAGERAQQLTFYRAVGLWFDGRLEEALALLEGLSREAPVGVDALIALTVWACELTRPALAADALARLVALDPAGEQVAPALLRQLQGRVVLLSASPAEARAALDDLMAWAEEQGDGEDLRALGWALEAGLAADALERAEALLAAGPPRAALWLLAARAHRALAQPDAALYAFDQWRALRDPEHTAPLLEWAGLLELSGQLARAREALDALCALEPDAHSYRLERALFLTRAGQLAAAERELHALLDAARAEDADAQGPPGAQGAPDAQDPPDAQGAPTYARAPLGPAAEHVLSLLLSQAYHSADLGELHALVERLLGRLGAHPTLRGFLGLTLRALGDHDASLEPLREGAAHDSYFGSEYAHALWESGARREAVGALLECVEAAPDLPEHHEDLVRFLLELEDAQGALHHLLRLQALAPDDADLDELTRLVYEAIGVH